MRDHVLRISFPQKKCLERDHSFDLIFLNKNNLCLATMSVFIRSSLSENTRVKMHFLKFRIPQFMLYCRWHHL